MLTSIVRWIVKVAHHIPSIAKEFALSVLESVFLSVPCGRIAHRHTIMFFSLVTIAPSAGYVVTEYWIFATSRGAFGWRVLPLPSKWERLGRAEQNGFLDSFRASYVVDSRPESVRPIGARDNPLHCTLPLRALAWASP